MFYCTLFVYLEAKQPQFTSTGFHLCSVSRKMIPQSIRQWDKWLKTKMSSNSLGCKSSLSSNLIFKKHHDSRLLFHITISFVKPPYNHKLTRSQNVRRILMLVTPVNVDRGLSDVTFFQFKYFLVKKLTENSVFLFWTTALCDRYEVLQWFSSNILICMAAT